MKKFSKALVILLVLSGLALFGCDKDDIIKKGGTIVVTNGLSGGGGTGVTDVENLIYVIVKKLELPTEADLKTVAADLKKTENVIQPTRSNEYPFNENGIYTVFYIRGGSEISDFTPQYEPVPLFGGNTQTITLPKN